MHYPEFGLITGGVRYTWNLFYRPENKSRSARAMRVRESALAPTQVAMCWREKTQSRHHSLSHCLLVFMIRKASGRESRGTALVKHSTNKTLTSTGLKPTTTCSSPDSNTSLKQQSVTYFETRCLKKQRYIIYNDTKEIAASCDTLRSVKRSKCLAFSWSISYILTVNPKLLTIRILLINLSIHWLPVSGNHYTKST